MSHAERTQRCTIRPMSDTSRRAGERWFRALTVVSIVIGFLTGLIYLWAMFAEEFGSAFSGEDPNPRWGEWH